jgi:hypothetical protein
MHQSLCLVAAITAPAFFIGVGSDLAPQAMAAENHKAAAIFEPIIPQLHDSKTPVYLPAGLVIHRYKKTYPSASLGDYEYPEGYQVTVAAVKSP